MKKLGIILVLVLLSGGIAYGSGWSQEPGGFRGVRWRSSEADAVKIIIAMICSNYESWRICASDFTLGDITSVTSVMTFRRDEFVEVSGHFDSRDYDAVKLVFVDKYGPPMKIEESVVQNNAGAKFNQEELSWDGLDVRATLSRYGSNVAEGSFLFQTQTYREEHAREIQDKLIKAKKSL